MSSQAAAQPDVPVDRLMRELERQASRAGWASLGGERVGGLREEDSGEEIQEELSFLHLRCPQLCTNHSYTTEILNRDDYVECNILPCLLNYP